MSSRVVQIILFALLIGPLSVPGSAVMHLENRVGGSAHFSSTFTSESAAQVADPHQGCLPSDYDHASGLHK